jgi:ATP-dependent Clp protease ATP-binding subunit ClpA
MFERFSESASRVIFGARIVAVRLGANYIEPEHILRGLLAEDQGDWLQAMSSHFGEQPIWFAAKEPRPLSFFTAECAGTLRRMLPESLVGAPKPDTEDMPLAAASKQVLASAFEHTGSSRVTLLHILWGLLSVEQDAAAILLKTNGVTAEQVDSAIRNRR